MSTDRYIRQSTVVGSQEKLEQEKVMIVGVGAVGKEVAEQLAAIGVKDVTLIDMDKIELQNCTTQKWFEEDDGKMKVDVCAARMKSINSNCNPVAIAERWRPKLFEKQKEPFTAIFNCVDMLSTRLLIFNYHIKDTAFMFDARIGGQQIELVSVFDEESAKKYPDTIVDDEDAYEEAGCHGSPMVSYSATTAASFLVQQFVCKFNGGVMYQRRSFTFNDSNLLVM